MKEKTTYKSKGYLNFAYREDGLQYLVNEYPKEFLDMHEMTLIGDLMDGKQFYERVDDGCIIDYDGSLSHVFVDGYISNLGLCHGDLCQGGFLVDGPTWLDICEEFKVEVEWCNR